MYQYPSSDAFLDEHNTSKNISKENKKGEKKNKALDLET